MRTSAFCPEMFLKILFYKHLQIDSLQYVKIRFHFKNVKDKHS